MNATDLFEKEFGISKYFIDKREAIRFAEKYSDLKHEEFNRKKEIFQSNQFNHNIEERRNKNIER